jgi:ABC-type dipeptide/oligopeptide/nickel transport system permease component
VRNRRSLALRSFAGSALTPVLTQLGIDLGTLLGGVIVTD